VIALLASVVLAAATATPPPTIIRERVSPVCSALHQLVIPLAQMNIKDKPVIAAIRAARLQLGKYRGTLLGDGLFLYNSRIDMLYTNVLANLTDMDQYLIKSYRTYPQGTNSKVDALRQRVQNVVDYRMNLQDAVNAPRLHMQWLPDEIQYEPGALAPAAMEKLRAMGYRFRRIASWGSLQAVLVDPKSGARMGAADRRHPAGAALGY